jgi:hypothetical protein
MGTSDFIILPLMEVSVKSGEGHNESFRQRETVLYHGSPIMFISSPQEIVLRMVFAVASPSETTPLFPLVRLQLSRFRRVMCPADF